MNLLVSYVMFDLNKQVVGCRTMGRAVTEGFKKGLLRDVGGMPIDCAHSN